MSQSKKYMILQRGNQQWMVQKGSNLEVDFLNTTEDSIELDCVFDSEKGICNSKVTCLVKKPMFLDRKITIVKYRRRKASRRKKGFRATKTLLVVGG
jgi:ribosomal protein L21